MEQHPNARLTPRGRETPCLPCIESGLGVAEAARQMGVSRQTASKWLRRSRSGEGLGDRSSRPRRLARLTPPEAEERVAAARRELMLAPLGLAAATGVPARTCARIVARRGMPRLADVDRVTGEVRRRARHPRALRAREARGAGPRGHQEGREDPGRRRLEGPRGVRPRAPGLGRRLRLPARRSGRLQPRRLRRAAARRAEGHLRGVHAAGPALLRGPRPDGGARHDRQRPGLPQRRVQRAARRRRRPARSHEALQPVAERQGGADEPHYRAGVAVRKGMESEAGRADALPAFIERYNWERPHSACGACRPCRASWV